MLKRYYYISCINHLIILLYLRSILSFVIFTGKAASQCAHGTLKAYNKMQENDPATVQAWEITGQAKVVVKATTVDDIYSVEKVRIV